ncbi:trifunctional dihydropteroate synthetase [Gonapodya sp. JEL0774]|nr:trifunctional dihydropteroate synthetase [Gonapodya sp. JEL0774]
MFYPELVKATMSMKSAAFPPLDRIMVDRLSVRSIIGLDSWERRRPQPVTISVAIHTNIRDAGNMDSLARSISYAHVAKAVTELSETSQYATVEELAARIAELCIADYQAPKISVKVEKPKALLHASKVSMQITRTRASLQFLERFRVSDSGTNAQAAFPITPTPVWTSNSTEEIPEELYDDVFTIENLQIDAVVGVNPWERLEKQKVSITIHIHGGHPETESTSHSTVPVTSGYRTIANAVTKFVVESNFLTLEGLATSIASVCFSVSSASKITVRVDKPSAILFANAAAVEITRYRPTPVHDTAEHNNRAGETVLDHISYLGIGTNIGNRSCNIHRALHHLNQKCRVLDTSFLYETSPMYEADQPNFLNCAVKISTTLSPLALLAYLKTIERELGREATKRNGPRVIDLDILLFDHSHIQEIDLVVPHEAMAERDFVLRPLCDIAPSLVHPTLKRTIRDLLSSLYSHPSSEGGSVMRRVTPVRDSLWSWGAQSPTRIMGIINVTPDSFSDGGDRLVPEIAGKAAWRMAEDGADIIDVGGVSTRPNADEPSEEEELARVVPAVRAIRAAGVVLPISVDTFRARVAREALAAGADLINDVSSGEWDPEIATVLAQMSAPICLMHTRGNPRTMTSLTQYGDDLVGDIRRELSKRVAVMVASGVPRWNVVVDPGIGFAKTGDHNLEILRRLPDLTAPGSELEGFPVLVGASRKGFIGKLTEQKDPKLRGWGTAATSVAAVAGGAGVIRVHDVKESRDVLRVADAIWKTARTS